MPDGDKFYWGVKGPGSRTVLNLARRSASIEFLADHGATIVTEHLQNPGMRQVMRHATRILEALLRRVDAGSTGHTTQEAVWSAFRTLRHQSNGDEFEAVALHVFENLCGQLRMTGSSLAPQALRHAISIDLAKGILGFAVLDNKRAAIMRETGRSKQEQLLLEQRLVSEVADRIGPNIDRVLEGRGDERLRAPRRRAQRREFTLEELHAPIAVAR